MSVMIEESKLVVNRAKAIAAMGLVERDYEGFNVSSPGVKKETFRIWRDEQGRVRCSCPEFESRADAEPRFRCEHILAVKFHLEPPEDALDEQHAAALSSEYAAGELEAMNGEEAARAIEGATRSDVVMPFSQVLRQLSQSVPAEMV